MVANPSVGANHDRSVTLVSPGPRLIVRMPFFGPQCACIDDAPWEDAFEESFRRQRSVEV